GLPVQTEQGQFLNSIIALGTDAYGVYYKRQLVPFGEFVPFEAQIRGLVGFFDLPMSHGVPGPDVQGPLHAGTLRFSPLVCYEIVYPELALSSLNDANILLTLSNDTWFGRSIGPHQHFEMARMRALELGRFLIRSTNNGISAIIDHRGTVTAHVPQFIATTLIGTVFATEGYTPLYFLTHSFVLILSSLLLITALLLQLGKFSRRSSH
ncbi:MAG TPA: apolipoprotein N-acyltransferase, partial [Gammaproteobacteria bacterium]|nr:apolipoprotein N-acyltransferase [Gammaproteobacteria bacterium]